MSGAARVSEPPRRGPNRVVLGVIASVPVVVTALAVACYVLNHTVLLEMGEALGRPVDWTWPNTVFLCERIGALVVAVCLAVAVLQRRPMAGWLALGFVPVSVAAYLPYLPAPLFDGPASRPFPATPVLAWTAAAATLLLAFLVPHASGRRRYAPRVFAGAALLMVYLIAGNVALAELFRATWSWRAWWGELVVYPGVVMLAVAEVALLAVIAGLLGGLGHRLRPAVALIAGMLAARALFFATFLDGPLVSACGTGDPRVAAIGGITIASTTLLGAGLLLFERWRAARLAFGLGAVLGLAAVAAGFAAQHSGTIWARGPQALGIMVCCFACLAVAVAAPSSSVAARRSGRAKTG